jgi:hypothetical protein
MRSNCSAVSVEDYAFLNVRLEEKQTRERQRRVRRKT